MRICLINDCNSPDPAPGCLDCDDRCPRTDNIYCVGVIDDSKGISQTNNQNLQRDR